MFNDQSEYSGQRPRLQVSAGIFLRVQKKEFFLMKYTRRCHQEADTWTNETRGLIRGNRNGPVPSGHELAAGRRADGLDVVVLQPHALRRQFVQSGGLDGRVVVADVIETLGNKDGIFSHAPSSVRAVTNGISNDHTAPPAGYSRSRGDCMWSTEACVQTWSSMRIKTMCGCFFFAPGSSLGTSLRLGWGCSADSRSRLRRRLHSTAAAAAAGGGCMLDPGTLQRTTTHGNNAEKLDTSGEQGKMSRVSTNSRRRTMSREQL